MRDRVPFSRGARVLSVLLSGIVGLAVCEAAARVLIPRPPDSRRQPQIKYVPYPDVGYFHIPGERGWIDEGWVTINSHGFRGPDPDLPKPSGRFRIMVLGDSVTLGWGVNDAETYPEQLAGLLVNALSDRTVDVLNCGVSGYDTAQEAQVLRRFGPLFQPDLVLLGFYWNDLQNPLVKPVAVQDEASARDRSLAGEFQLGADPSRLNALMRRSRLLFGIKGSLRALRNSVMGPDINELWVRWEAALLSDDRSSLTDKPWERLRDRLRLLASIAADLGSPVVLLLLPSRLQASTDALPSRFNGRVTEMSKALGLDVVDLLPQFVARGPRAGDLFIPYDNDHLTAEGHGLVAKAVVQYLVHHRLPAAQ